MTRVKFNPFSPETGYRFHNNFDRLLSDAFNAPLHNDDVKISTPSVNVTETAENFRLDIAAPGLVKEDFKVNIEDKTLTVSAEKKNETQEGDKQLRREFAYFTFSRAFTLPETVAVEDIKATYNAGILTLTLPKVEPKKTVKMIDIQ